MAGALRLVCEDPSFDFYLLHVGAFLVLARSCLPIYAVIQQILAARLGSFAVRRGRHLLLGRVDLRPRWGVVPGALALPVQELVRVVAVLDLVVIPDIEDLAC